MSVMNMVINFFQKYVAIWYSILKCSHL